MKKIRKYLGYFWIRPNQISLFHLSLYHGQIYFWGRNPGPILNQLYKDSVATYINSSDRSTWISRVLFSPSFPNFQQHRKKNKWCVFCILSFLYFLSMFVFCQVVQLFLYVPRFSGTEERYEGYCSSKKEDGEDSLFCLSVFVFVFFKLLIRRFYSSNFRRGLLTHFSKRDPSSSVLEVHFHLKGIFTGSSNGLRLSAYRDKGGYLSRD